MGRSYLTWQQTRETAPPWGRHLGEAALELGLSHSLKQFGGGRRKEGSQRSQVVTGSLTGVPCPRSHLFISPMTRGGVSDWGSLCFQTSIADLSSLCLTLLPPGGATSFPRWVGCQGSFPGDVSYRVPVSSSHFGHGLILCQNPITCFVVLESDLWGSGMVLTVQLFGLNLVQLSERVSCRTPRCRPRSKSTSY